MEDKLHIVVTEQLMSTLKRKYPQLGNGLIITRLIGLPDTHKAFMKTLKKCLNGDDLERFKELENLIKNKDDKGVKDWCKETDKKFNIEPYKTDMPGFERKLKKSEIQIHSYDSDIDEKLLTEYKNWLKKWHDDIKDIKIDKDTNWCEKRLLFTPLDLLIDKYKLDSNNPVKLDIDKCYWNMMKALEELCDELEIERLNPDKYKRYNYLWVHKKCYDCVNKEYMIKYSDRVGYSQFEQNVLKR